MMTRSRPVSMVTRAVLGGIAAGAVIGLAACGSTTAAGRAAPAQGAGGRAAQPASRGPLCRDIPQLDRVVISRTGGLPVSHFHLTLPAAITLTDPAKVRSMAAILCALPLMPHGVMHCPADLGGAYRMIFSAPGRAFPPVTVQVTGCQTVTGLGPPRRAGVRFWRAAGKVLGATPRPTGSTGMMPH